MAAPLAGPDQLMARILEASRDPAKLPAALMCCGAALSVAALSLIISKAPGGVFLRLHGGGPAYSYYGILIAMVIVGIAEAAFGYWVVPRDTVGWHAFGRTLLWSSILAIIVVAAFGGIAFIK